MSFWEMTTNVEARERATSVFPPLEDKVREVVLQRNLKDLNEDGMEIIYNRHFEENRAQSVFDLWIF